MAQRNENEMYSISNDDDAILSTENNTENAAEPSIDTEQCGENLRGEDAEESELLSVVLPSSSRPPPGVTGGDIVDTAAGKSTDFSLIQKQQSVSAPINDAELPDSVIGAPEVLKPAIRKKQNKAVRTRSFIFSFFPLSFHYISRMAVSLTLSFTAHSCLFTVGAPKSIEEAGDDETAGEGHHEFQSDVSQFGAQT